MASIGASCAQVYVMQKRQEEKMKRMEEERAAGKGESKVEEEGRKVAAVGGPSKKVHPGHFPPEDSAGKPAETCNNSNS
jgi:hypothetical protein